MKRFLWIFIVLFPVFGTASINECLSDVYFANGVLTNEGNASANTDLLRKTILFDTYQGDFDKFSKQIGKVKEAYNSTHGPLDFLESLEQKLGIDNLIDFFWDTAHKRDLHLQIKHYKESIKNGHKVLIVAHSQGNLFTYDAYQDIRNDNHNFWMVNYMDIISIASPQMIPIKAGLKPISWDNDFVAWLGIYTSGMIHNDIRNIGWERVPASTGNNVDAPESNYIFDKNIGEIYKDTWIPNELPLLGNPGIDVHAFTFYMGEPIPKKADPFDNLPLQTNKAKKIIVAQIKSKLDALHRLQSQWKIVKQPNHCDSCDDFTVEVAHRFDASVQMKEKVMPFNTKSFKLYRVDK
uniref:hypothetical protein n=1 Tax=Sulfurovum sp. TaxID=1969726 RepID=UPI0025E15FE1